MIGVEETLESGRYVVALQDIPSGTPIHMSTAFCHGRYIPPMRAAPGNHVALYPNRHCSHCAKTILFGDDEGKQCKGGYSAAGVAIRCPICRVLCYCSDKCRDAHSSTHKESLECLTMGLILKGRNWYDNVYYPIYANQPALLAPSSYGIPRKRATPNSTPPTPSIIKPKPQTPPT